MFVVMTRIQMQYHCAFHRHAILCVTKSIHKPVAAISLEAVGFLTPS